MAQVDASRRPPRYPWSFRLFDAAPLPPAAVGLALAALLRGIFVGLHSVTGGLSRLDAELSSGVFRGTVFLLLMLAYLPTADFYLARWTQRNLEALEPLLRRPRGDTRPEALRRSPGSRWVGSGGALLFVAMFLVLPFRPDVYFELDYWTLEHAVPWLAVPLLGWLMARFAFALVADAHTVSTRARDLERLDLIDPKPLEPFVQQGLEGALLVMLMLAAGMGGIVGQDVVLPSAVATVAAMLGVGAAALITPVVGVRQRIRAEKHAQLAAVRARIDADRAAVLAGTPELDRVSARLPGLLALEERIERVREWPFGASSLLRFAFYLLLGLGSWLGAAFVERLLDAAIG